VIEKSDPVLALDTMDNMIADSVSMFPFGVCDQIDQIINSFFFSKQWKEKTFLPLLKHSSLERRQTLVSL